MIHSGSPGMGRKPPTAHPHQRGPCRRMSPCFVQHGVSEKCRTAESISKDVQKAYSLPEPRHGSRQECILVVITAKTLPELFMALGVEGVRLQTEICHPTMIR